MVHPQNGHPHNGLGLGLSLLRNEAAQWHILLHLSLFLADSPFSVKQDDGDFYSSLANWSPALVAGHCI